MMVLEISQPVVTYSTALDFDEAAAQAVEKKLHSVSKVSAKESIGKALPSSSSSVSNPLLQQKRKDCKERTLQE